MTSCSLGQIHYHPLLAASLGMLLKTSMMMDIRDPGDCFFVRGSVNISPGYVILYVVKWINIKRARRPDLHPLRQVSLL
jgi:hypothetical protein